ncbi:hypothetical protein J6590_042609 [Homalodisca vitripennis]|nr:hypothetical protein J6590_042609 [Homalodisca vitripennis]
MEQERLALGHEVIECVTARRDNRAQCHLGLLLSPLHLIPPSLSSVILNTHAESAHLLS